MIDLTRAEIEALVNLRQFSGETRVKTNQAITQLLRQLDAETARTVNQRDAYDAFTAMRNDINELIGNMVSQEHNLEPGMGQECEAVVEAVRGFIERPNARADAAAEQMRERVLDVFAEYETPLFLEERIRALSLHEEP